jgi:hypothetical protein
MQNLKVSRRALKVPSLEKTAQTKLNSRTVAKRIVTLPSFLQLLRYSMPILVFGAKFANCFFTYAIHILDQIWAEIGCSPMKHVTFLRMRQATLLFQATGLNVSAVA